MNIPKQTVQKWLEIEQAMTVPHVLDCSGDEVVITALDPERQAELDAQVVAVIGNG